LLAFVLVFKLENSGVNLWSALIGYEVWSTSHLNPSSSSTVIAPGSRTAAPRLVGRTEHVGSTSILDLAANSVADLLARGFPA
jgi:hypothetical protein